MSRVALVPARGGSKAIPQKNIRLFCGRPLIYWVCRAANDCAALDAVYVATEDDAIAETVRSLGLDKVQVIGRAPETATDHASTESVLLDFAARVDFTHVALLQATSPLLATTDLDQGWAAMERGHYDSVLSVVRQERFRWRIEAGDQAHPENYDPAQRPRRQEFDGFLVENGAFYITSRTQLLSSQCRLSGRIGVVEMPKETYYELDDSVDWTIMEQLLRQRLVQDSGAMANRIQRLKLIATDVDGSLTDSGIYYAEEGDELKKYNTRDGMGFALLREAGLLTGIVTREDRAMNVRRAHKLKADELHQAALDKVAVMENILARRGLAWEDVAFFGDDIGDLEVLKRVGLAGCPADAIPEVRAVCHFTANERGGHGAFRAFADFILLQRGPAQ